MSRKIFRYIDQALLRTYSYKRSNLKPIFLIGMIRSGTTVVSQTIFNRYKFSYISNLARRYPNLPFIANFITRYFGSKKQSYDSKYGLIDGVHSLSDGWEVYNRFFPYSQNIANTRFEALNEFKSLVNAIKNLYDLPFLIKNNSNSLRLIEHNSLFPNAVYIRVNRSIYDSINSVIKARASHQIEYLSPWGVFPDQCYYKSFNFKSEIQLLVFQYLYVNKYMDIANERLNLRTLPIDYDEFCMHKEKTIDQIDEFFRINNISLIDRQKNLNLENIQIRKKKYSNNFIADIDKYCKEYTNIDELVLNRFESDYVYFNSRVNL